MAISSVGGNGSFADGNKVESTTRQRQAPSSSTLTMDGFMQLLAKQMENQDMNNTTSNAEMMQQLTSMATVQSMNTFTELSSTQYALNMMGQEVTVAKASETTGKMESKKGKVVGVNLSTMKLFIEGDDAAYGLGNIMEVGKVPAAKDKDDDKDDDKVDDKDDDDKVDDTDGTGGSDSDNKNSKSSRMAAVPNSSTADPNKTNNSNLSTAAYAAGEKASASVKSFTDTGRLRTERLANDKREALERQNEIPEDKKLILASMSSGKKATGPAAVGTGNQKVTLDPTRI